MRSFRSNYLKAASSQSRENRAEVVRRRLFLTVTALFLIGIPCLIVVLEWLPTEGAGFPLYWLHDHVFLPVKGWTYHRFAPASAIWWTLVLLFLITWLIFYLVDESLILSPHRDLVLYALNRPRVFEGLLRSSAWLCRRGLPPGLLRTAIDYRAETLARELARGQGDPGKLRPVSSFQVQIYMLPGATPAHRLWAGHAWQMGRLLVDEHESRFLEVPLLLGKSSSPSQKSWQTQLIDPPAPFTVDDFLRDLLLIAALDHRPTRRWLFGNEAVSGPLSEQITIVCQHLGEANERRRNHLEDLRQDLQSLAFEPYRRIELGTPFPDQEEACLPILGQLTMGSAHLLGKLRGRPEPGQLMLETLESLVTCLTLFDEEDREDPAFEAFATRCEHFVSRVPGVFDFQICARLDEHHIEQRRQAVRTSALAGSDLVREDDFATAAAHARLLAHAAGPGFRGETR